VRDRLRPIFRAAIRTAPSSTSTWSNTLQGHDAAHLREILEEDEFAPGPTSASRSKRTCTICERDVVELADWAARRGTPVLGPAYQGGLWDYETVVAAQEIGPPRVQQKWETDDNYERMTLFLLENRDLLRPAFGSHNIAARPRHGGRPIDELPPRTFEIQMLYGMADEVKHSLVRLGQRVRVHNAVCQLLPGMAYLVRRLLENTANTFLLAGSFTEHVPEEKLLMNPIKQSVVSSPWSVANIVPHSDGRIMALLSHGLRTTNYGPIPERTRRDFSRERTVKPCRMPWRG